MNKQEFLTELKKGLSGLPNDDINERLNFYSEIIDDRIEDGVSEEVAVSEIGNTDEIIKEIIADIPITKLVKERIVKKRKLSVIEVVLLVLGSPIWLSLLIAVCSVILTVYIVLWALIIAFWALFISLVGCTICGITAGVFFAVKGNALTGIAVFGAGLFVSGLSIFMFFICKIITKAILLLTKRLAVCIKNRFIKKEEA